MANDLWPNQRLGSQIKRGKQFFDSFTGNKNPLLDESTSAKILDQILGAMSGENQKENQRLQMEAAEKAMAFEQASADKAMKFSADQAAIERKWYEQMSSSAHQREVADLKAAGLNPILAANGGAASAATGVATGFSGNGHQADVDTYNQTLGLLSALSGVLSSASRLVR